MKTNELSDKELRDIFRKQKRGYNDDYFRIQVMRKIDLLNSNPFKRIMAMCSVFYLLYFIFLFFPSVQIFVINKIQGIAEQTGHFSFNAADFYLIYVFLMVLLIIELIRVIRNNYKTLF